MNSRSTPAGLKLLFLSLGTDLQNGSSPPEALKHLTAMDIPPVTALANPFQKDMDRGASFAAAAENHPALSPRQADLIAAGESLGNLPEVLIRLAHELEDSDSRLTVEGPRLALNPLSLRLMVLSTFLCLMPGVKALLKYAHLDVLLGVDKFIQGFAILAYLYHRWQQKPETATPVQAESDFVVSLANIGMVLADAAIIALGLLTLIVPQFQEIYAGMRIEPPLATQLILLVTGLLAPLIYVFPAFFLVPIVLRNQAVAPGGQKRVLSVGQQIPLVGTFFRELLLLATWESARSLITWGVPARQAMAAAVRTSRHEEIRRRAPEILDFLHSPATETEPEDSSGIPIPAYLREVLREQPDRIDYTHLGDALRSEKARSMRKLEGYIGLTEFFSILMLGGFLFLAVNAIFMPQIGLVNCVD